VVDLGLGDRGKAEKGALGWRHHSQPSIIRRFDQAQEGDMLATQRYVPETTTWLTLQKMNKGISVRHGDAGDAVASLKLKNWPLFGKSIQVHSRVSEVVSIFPTKAKQWPKRQNNLRLFWYFFLPLIAK